MTKSNPKISVIMPFYNAEKFLDEATQSILNQTFSDFEFIIINDASTDESDKIVQRYLVDRRIKYVKNEINRGITRNLNCGIRMAKAGLIARMDGDDISSPERLERQFSFLQNNEDIDIVGSFASVINENGNQIGDLKFAITPEEINERCFYYGPFLHPTVLFRKKAIYEVGMYREKYSLCQDLDLFLRLVHKGYLGANIPEFLLKYRKHSLSSDYKKHKKAVLGLKLKREVIKEHRIKPGMRILFFIYAGYLLSYISRKYQAKITTFSKKVLGLR
jgi:glycosyltransferase EpsE